MDAGIPMKKARVDVENGDDGVSILHKICCPRWKTWSDEYSCKNDHR